MIIFFFLSYAYMHFIFPHKVYKSLGVKGDLHILVETLTI